MKNSFLLLFIIFRIRIVQVFRVVISVVKGKTSYYPPSVKELERKFKELTGDEFSIMFSNATSAIEAALFALGVNENSYVGTTAFVIPSSYCAAEGLGANIKFIDVSDSTLNLDAQLLYDSEMPMLDVLIVTHFYGNPCDMPSIMKWANDHNVTVIEDCSHAHGASISGKPVGSWGDIGVFSLQGAKAVAAGEGGIAVTNNTELAWKMAAYGHQESYKKFDFGNKLPPSDIPPFGYGKKMRSHPLGADLALADLKYLTRKNKVYERFVSQLEILAGDKTTFSLPLKCSNSNRGGYCQGVPIIFKTNLAASDFLDNARSGGINSFQRNYTDSIKYYSGYGSSEVESSLSRTHELFGRVVYLPFYQFVDFRRWFRLVKLLEALDK